MNQEFGQKKVKRVGSRLSEELSYPTGIGPPHLFQQNGPTADLINLEFWLMGVREVPFLPFGTSYG